MEKRNKSSEGRNFDCKALVLAVKACLLEKISQKGAAKTHGVKRTTLRDHLKKVKEEFNDVSQVSDDCLLEFITSNHTKTPPNMVS